MTRNASNELGEFLRARRAELTPRSVGLPGGTVRRVPGLRREEVAMLAAISTDHYTRLEQGRIQASEPVLDAITRVLDLDEDQRAYVFELAGKEPARPRPQGTQKVQPQLRRLLDDLTSIPAMVLGHQMDVLAWNPLAAALVGDFAQLPAEERNYARMVFSPAMRKLYADWETTARTTVAQLRMEAAHNAGSPRLTTLVNDLSEQDPDFRRWWVAHHVAARTTGTKTLNHPIAGTLVLEWDTLTAGTDPDQQLIIWTAAPDTPTEEGLRFLASWAAGGQEADRGTSG
ncbi:helix-turn-helix transcriptional regulator [Streptomyces mirabilis]|jgi:transcriptional regulator with XRE-family HTH domain|uniref:Helix-turn-helix domain-containing protein n=1 Tax=Streptomyces mirabilis TaxID=68239 RepID=A0A1I2DBN2_9ACTN|nr:helix-turn-helix transcriptional regulator [Streptomyces mirabilis]SFE77831.1 Helix-turn-helix domain-containing protein [Streptomyces mirabilis]